MQGFEELLIRQGAMVFGLIVLIAVAYLFFNAIVKKD